MSKVMLTLKSFLSIYGSHARALRLGRHWMQNEQTSFPMDGICTFLQHFLRYARYLSGATQHSLLWIVFNIGKDVGDGIALVIAAVRHTWDVV